MIGERTGRDQPKIVEGVVTNEDKFDGKDCDGPCVLTNPEWKNSDHEALLISPTYNTDGSYKISLRSDHWVDDGGIIWRRKNIASEPDGSYGQCLVCPRHTESLVTTLNLLKISRMAQHEL